MKEKCFQAKKFSYEAVTTWNNRDAHLFITTVVERMSITPMGGTLVAGRNDQPKRESVPKPEQKEEKKKGFNPDHDRMDNEGGRSHHIEGHPHTFVCDD